jgi:DNA-binding CsgD family transcriptional regulator
MKQPMRPVPAWERKNLSGILAHFLATNCPQLGGALMIEPVVKEIIRLFDEFCPPVERLKMGQVVWYAVDVNEKSGYGKSIDQCKLNAVILDLVNLEDIDDLLRGLNKRERQKKVAARLFEQAYEQGSVMTGADVAAIMRLSPGTVCRYVCELEKERGRPIPRRGNIHDMGPTLTHKRIICIKCLKEGKTVELTARETNHSPEAVTRYINDFKRVYTCLNSGWEIDKISYATGLSKSLTQEYVNLINEERSEK